jgi:hypothetical protein
MRRPTTAGSPPKRDCQNAPRSGFFSQIDTSRSGSENGSGRRITALTTEKIAVLAPMPRAMIAAVH